MATHAPLDLPPEMPANPAPDADMPDKEPAPTLPAPDDDLLPPGA